MDKPPREATDQVLRLRLRLRASPPPPAPGRYRAAGPGGTLPSTGSHQAGTAGSFAGDPSVRRSAVIRRHGSAGRSWAGTVCLIAGSSTVRWLAGGDPPGRFCWSLPGGHSVSDRWDATSCRAGGGLPGRPGSAGRCQAAGTVCLIAGRAPTGRAGGGPPAGICWVLPGEAQCARPERCGPRAESAVRASRAGGAKRASRPVCGQSPRWGPAPGTQTSPAGVGY
jgi:hypothetical protein